MLKRTCAASTVLLVTLSTAASTSVAGTYSFALPPTKIALGAMDGGSSAAFRALDRDGVAARSPARTFADNAFGGRWLALPAGAVFSSLSGTVRYGTSSAAVGPVRATIVVRRPDRSTARVVGLPIAHGDQSAAWEFAGSGSPNQLRVALEAVANGRCPGCRVILASLRGSIDDPAPPTATRISSTAAGRATASREIAITWTTTDAVAGPADVWAEVDGMRGPTPLRRAPSADNSRILGQRSGGARTVAGTSTLRLPDADGTHTVRIVAADAVGNETRSDAVSVRLDRRRPSLSMSAPTGWCRVGCLVAITAHDVSGIAGIAADANGTPIRLAAVTGHPVGASRSFDAARIGLEGRLALHVRVTDRAGNVTDRSVSITIDRSPPAIAAANADPLRRIVDVGLSDVSGIDRVTATIGNSTVALAASGRPSGGVRTYVAHVPDSVGASLDGRAVRIAAVDLAGNVARQTITFGTRSRTTISVSVDRRLVTAGGNIHVAGRVRSGRARNVLVDVVLDNPHWPAYRQHWRIRTLRGRFSLRIKPHIVGVLRVAFPGDSEGRSASRAFGRVGVRPRLSASFRFVRDARGAATALRTAGRFSPASGPPAGLEWQAHAAGGSGWFTICRDGDGLVARRGRFAGTCRVPGLGSALRFRVAFRPTPGAAYAAAASKGAPAR